MDNIDDLSAEKNGKIILFIIIIPYNMPKISYIIVTSPTVHKASAETNTPLLHKKRRACGKAHLNCENSIQKLRAAQFFSASPTPPT